MNKNKCCYLLLLLSCFSFYAQHGIRIRAVLDAQKRTLDITQKIDYQNTSDQLLDTIYLLDWANSFSNKATPLAHRFSEDYKRNFHYAKEHERGSTHIESISNACGSKLFWLRDADTPDILKVVLDKPLPAGASTELNFSYKVKIHSDRFTNYGFTKYKDFNLEYWHIAPAVFTDRWEVFSNKDLQDIYLPLIDYAIDITLPEDYKVTTVLAQTSIKMDDSLQEVRLRGRYQNEVKLYVNKINTFYSVQIDSLKVISNVTVRDLTEVARQQKILKIINFLRNNLGSYPLKSLLISNLDCNKNPLYGLNQLPDFVRPFSDGFHYEIQMLKCIADAYLKTSLSINQRRDKWVTDGILIYLMMDYINTHYPNIKLGGDLADFFGLRWFHGADLLFNEQYYLGYKNMARNLIDQSLDTPRDSLLKFNYNIANPYKAGLGLKYLEDYLNDSTVTSSIKQFFNRYALKRTTAADFKSILVINAKKNIDWFFNEYVGSNTKIDYKIKKIVKKKDSLKVILKNKRNNNMPISIHGIKDDSIISKSWVQGFTGKKTIVIPDKQEEKLVLDYEKKIPEIKRNNNYRNLNGILNKPLQFRFIKDIEDPSRSQVFFMPVIEFNNIYDGITLGGKFYNKTVLKRPFIYKITPTYGFRSRTLIGSISLGGFHQLKESGWYAISGGIHMNKNSYAPGLFYKSITPNLRFNFRNKDLRNNEFQYISLRSVNISRDKSPDIPLQTPDYSVYNLRYTYSNANFDQVLRFWVDTELAKNFSKLSATIKYRKLFVNNRQIDIRFYGGTFLKNNTQADNGFFDFGLDRPTDYLFNYGYLGRSESTGLTSQQFITAEGGFKSILDTRFANQWITTANVEASIWNWIFAYGDVGLVKNKGHSPQLVWDSGIKLNLVADYFELYFPIASTKGFELGQGPYGEKIRFKITLNPKTLLGLFTRRWY